MGKDSDEKPAGGYDPTPIHPQRCQTYDVKITFHYGKNIAVGDLSTQSSDPFILAQLEAPGNPGRRHKNDPPLQFRSPAVTQSRNPTWDCEWVVSGVPENGVTLSVTVKDQDVGSLDDTLGHTHIGTGRIGKDYNVHRREYTVSRKRASGKVIARNSCLKVCSSTAREAQVVCISIENVRPTPKNLEVGKMYTINNFWYIHYSPLIGAMAGTTAASVGTGGNEQEQKNFQANDFQLRGPVPNEMYHRYVEFKPFVQGMFNSTGLRGKALNTLLHRQHGQIYRFDTKTQYGVLPRGPGIEMTKRFLDMTRWAEGARLFTYVITLDGLMRFTETGPEFGIDLLSKHTMHSDVELYIAFSGEFFVRKFKQGRLDGPLGKGEKAQPQDTSGDELDRVNDAQTRQADREKRAEEEARAGQDRLQGKGNDNEKQSFGADSHANGEYNEKAPLDNNSKPRPGSVREKLKKKLVPDSTTPNHVQLTTSLIGPSGHASSDPHQYQLVIDNDSGTYRPDKKLLPLLHDFLKANFVGLHVLTMACDDETHIAMKAAHKERHKRIALEAARRRGVSGNQLFAASASDLSSLMSDSSDEDRQRQGKAPKSGKEKGVDAIVDPKGVVKDTLKKVKRGNKGRGNGANGDDKTPTTRYPDDPQESDTPSGQQTTNQDAVQPTSSQSAPTGSQYGSASGSPDTQTQTQTQTQSNLNTAAESNGSDAPHRPPPLVTQPRQDDAFLTKPEPPHLAQQHAIPPKTPPLDSQMLPPQHPFQAQQQQ